MKIKKKIRANTEDIKDIIKNIVLLIPFFELQSFEMLIDEGIRPGFLNILLQVFSLLRIIITVYLFMDIFIKNKLRASSVVVCTLLFVLLENIVSFANGSIYLSYMAGSFTFIGFALMCSYMAKKSEYQFIIACKYLFGILSILGALQIIIMPYGFLHSSDKAFAIYLLGSKNSSFFYFVIYIFFAFYQDIQVYGKIKLKHILLEALFIIASVYADSMNTLVMLILIFIFAIVFNYGKEIYRLISPMTVIILTIVIAAVILVPEIRKKLEPVLQIIGRNTSFTGRDVLWEQAIADFIHRPLIGNGILTKFRLKTGVFQGNAHSHYLDLLAKYGIFVFVAYILIPICALAKSVKYGKQDKRFIALKSIIVFVILFHSITDHMPFYHFILIMNAIELLSVITDRKKSEKNVITCKEVSYG
ncbi:MAG: O-antigen ligase family protein [Lachnospiraceae bacterium]|nr:O-antigen ligase family protein [Lachnospiraceae bacterium]